MNPRALELQKRTRAFSVAVIALCERLPETPAARKIRDQLIDSATSVDSNYRAACRGRTHKEFTAKLGVVVEETDESLGWLTLLVDARICEPEEASSLIGEADQLLRIFTASEKTARCTEEEQRQMHNRRPRNHAGR